MFKKNSQKDSWEKFKKILDKESKFTDFWHWLVLMDIQ